MTTPEAANRLTGRDALRLHLMLAAGLTICIGGFCVEVIRALDGNGLSWMYVFEWPFFAGFAIYMWRKLLNEGPSEVPLSDDGGSAGGYGSTRPTDQADEALERWNRYLLDLREAESPYRDQVT